MLKGESLSRTDWNQRILPSPLNQKMPTRPGIKPGEQVSLIKKLHSPWDFLHRDYGQIREQRTLINAHLQKYFWKVVQLPLTK